MENVRQVIGENLAYLRKNAKLTQLEVADQFGYTDKSISKWEKGDALPDIETLQSICEFYGVDLDYLVTPLSEKDTYKPKRNINNMPFGRKIWIATLLVAFLWLIATVIYVYTYMYTESGYWMAFVWAIPLSLLALAILCPIYWRENNTLLFSFITAFIWTTLIAICVQTQIVGYNIWVTLLLGIPVQLILVGVFGFISFRPKKHPKK